MVVCLVSAYTLQEIQCLEVLRKYKCQMALPADTAGIRNVVGMQFHPVTKQLYFSNNGRDNIGDNVPDDYIAYAPVSGLNFGYPSCHRYCTIFISAALCCVSGKVETPGIHALLLVSAPHMQSQSQCE